MHSNFQLLWFVRDQERSLSEKLPGNIPGSWCGALRNCNRLTPLGKQTNKQTNNRTSTASYAEKWRDERVCTTHKDAQGNEKKKEEEIYALLKYLCLQNDWKYLQLAKLHLFVWQEKKVSTKAALDSSSRHEHISWISFSAVLFSF